MRVSILEPKGIIWEGNAKEVVLPAEDGEVSVLDFHRSFLMRLRKGFVRLSVSGFRLSQSLANREPRTINRILIKDGIAFMKSNALKVFVET